jgi:hypothetical protein
MSFARGLQAWRSGANLKSIGDSREWHEPRANPDVPGLQPNCRIAKFRAALAADHNNSMTG